jgi:1-acyl-sn-glycerol-3-phosphate acyltransferase
MDGEPDTGQTVDLAVDEVRHGLPVLEADLRDELPGIEPDRVLDDWGRSRRVEAVLDQGLNRFLYHYWFRVEVEGIENVPARGGALLAANHAGALPSDGLMVAKAVREEHPRRRSLSHITDRALKTVPALGMVATKIGTVAAHPANLQRLLFDEEQLALVFPEGRGGSGKPVNERYRLRPFEHGFVAAAARAGAPLVPVAVLGSEEAIPVLARLRPAWPLPAIGPLRRLRQIALPVVPAVPLPAKFRIRFLQPVVADRSGDHRAVADRIRALIQENLLEMVAERRSVWLG